jgi:hypothetical protein
MAKLQLKKIHIWVIGVVVCIVLLLMTGYFGELIEAVVFVALALLAYTLISTSAERYGVD